ncbi:hypothetical protein D3C74_370770 [compost metagenome]
MAEQHVLRIPVHPADDMPLQRISDRPADVFRLTSLSAAIHGEHVEAQRSISQLLAPVAGIRGIAVKQDYGRGRAFEFRRTHILGMNARSLDSGKIKMITFHTRQLIIGLFDTYLRINGAHLAQRHFPVSIEIRKLRVDSPVLA